MHPFFFAGALLHSFGAAVLAFFILFAASKSEGFIRFLGSLLGWILLLAAVTGLALGIYGAATGQHPSWMDHAHRGWMERPNGPEEVPPAGPQQPAPQSTPPKPQ